jgi:ribosomal protein S18 acetylase RimI-like enzyme
VPDATGFEIRPATRNDVEALATLRPFVHDKHVRAHPDYFKPLTHEAARGLADAWFSQADTRVLLASIAGEPIGYLMATIAARAEAGAVHARRVLVVDQIAVRASAHGQGYGKRLLAAGVALARELGIGIVELEVYHFNAEARAFFVSQGFEPLRERLFYPVK